MSATRDCANEKTVNERNATKYVSESCCQILEKYYFEMNNAYTKNITVDYVERMLLYILLNQILFKYNEQQSKSFFKRYTPSVSYE